VFVGFAPPSVEKMVGFENWFAFVLTAITAFDYLIRMRITILAMYFGAARMAHPVEFGTKPSYTPC
jgi:hypothetical protein